MHRPALLIRKDRQCVTRSALVVIEVLIDDVRRKRAFGLGRDQVQGQLPLRLWTTSLNLLLLANTDILPTDVAPGSALTHWEATATQAARVQ